MGNSPVKELSDQSKEIILKTIDSKLLSKQEVIEIITFAAGCFWGVELAFQRVPGVIKTEVGYTQGFMKSPTYEQVCSGSTGHVEAVQVTFNSSIISLDELLILFWDIHDPTTRNQQGGDVGTQYRSGVYYENDIQKSTVIESRQREQVKYGTVPVITEVLASRPWFPAEEYHQKYLQKMGQCGKTGDLSPIRCYG